MQRCLLPLGKDAFLVALHLYLGVDNPLHAHGRAEVCLNEHLL